MEKHTSARPALRELLWLGFSLAVLVGIVVVFAALVDPTVSVLMADG